MADNIDTKTVIAAPSDAATQPATPTPAAAPAEKQKLVDPFSDVRPAPKPAASKEQPKQEEKKPADDKPFEDTPKPADGKKVAGKKADPLAEQRQRIEQQNGIIAATTKERDELRQKIQALESRGGGDTAAMTKALDDLKKKNQQLAGEIAARDYSKSEEYQTKYEKPFNDAANYGRKIVESLQVLDVEGNPVRQAKWDTDFAALYHLPRPAARQQAKALFGEDANAVMSQYDELHRLQDAKEQALGEWQKGADEREQKTRADELVRSQNIQRAFDVVTQNYVENDPHFQIKPDDAEASDLWKKSQAIVDRAYFERDKLAPHELILLDAACRLRAINEPVLRAKLERVEAELADYKSRFEETDASAAGKTKRVAAPAEKAEEKSFEQDLRDTLAAVS